MPEPQINITLGTAGHVDHGKTALVKCLTGCDTDRLPAEKQRGMSIELGFAPCMLASGEVGIVDVPGHEHFIKTMVAGASGMDGVILVVAADDGVMPQTREHLDILTLLGIRHGLVALTKIDRIDAELVEVVRAELTELVAGTFLEGAPILPVSNVTGEGFDAFLTALSDLVHAIPLRATDGVFRFPVERTFSVKGYGTVVSGIPVAGTARIGDELVLLPEGVRGHIKAIQSYGRDSDVALAGRCTAVNVRHWDHHVIDRGCVVAVPGYFEQQPWAILGLRLLTRVQSHLKNGSKVKFHTGTSEVIASLYPLENREMRSGEECLVQARFATPVVVGPGDRFILRSLSPADTIGGGIVVEGVNRRLNRNHPGVSEDARARAESVRTREAFAEYCLRTAESGTTGVAELSRRAKVLPAAMKAMLGELCRTARAVQLAEDLYIHHDTAEAVAQELVAALSAYHSAAPASPGMSGEELRVAAPATRLDKRGFEAVLAWLLSSGRIVKSCSRLALPGHAPALPLEEQQQLDTVESLFARHLFQPPDLQAIALRAGLPPQRAEQLVRLLIEHQRLVRIAEGIVLHQRAVEEARARVVAHIREHGRLESVDFKYILDTTRKFAIPLLDYFDRVQLTVRVGNTRHLRRKDAV